MRVVDLGALVPYHDGMLTMRDAIARVDVDGPVLLLLEHTPTFTTTRRGGAGALLSSAAQIAADGIDVTETDRGGDVTFHGPGQLVGYPIVRLADTSLGSNIVGYVRALEAALVRASVALGVVDAHAKSERDADGNHLTGVWCDDARVRDDAKLCAIGVGVGGGVTRHGFALNIDIELERYLKHSVPCGLSAHTATSLQRVLASTPSRADVVAAVTRELAALWVLHRPLTR